MSLERRYIDGEGWKTVTSDPGGFVAQVSVELDADEILHLPSTPAEIVPTPGAGKRLLLVAGYVRSAFANGYGNIDSPAGPLLGGTGMLFTHGQDDSDASIMRSLSFFGSADVREFATAAGSITAQPDNAHADPSAGDDQSDKSLYLVVRNNNGDFTGGHASNRLLVSIAYMTIDVVSGEFV